MTKNLPQSIIQQLEELPCVVAGRLLDGSWMYVQALCEYSGFVWHPQIMAATRLTSEQATTLISMMGFDDFDILVKLTNTTGKWEVEEYAPE